MKILKIQIHNFLKLTAFKTGKLGKLNKITGDNEVGKSSVLKAIKEAFKSSGVDPQLIHLDGDKAEIVVELDENVLIQRNITATANTVKVTINGQPANSPQAWLNRLLGPFNFDPTAFFLADEKERRTRLLAAIPFKITHDQVLSLLPGELGLCDADFSSVDFNKHGLEALAAMQKIVYERRHEIGLDVTRQKKSIEQDKIDLGPTPDVSKFKGFDLQAAIKELGNRKIQIESHRKDDEIIATLRRQAQDKAEEIERLKRQLIQAESELAELRQRGTELVAKIGNFVAPDLAGLETQIGEYHSYQKVLNRLEDIQRREGQLEKSSVLYNALDGLHGALTMDIPRKILAGMKLPVRGLEIKGEEILVDGIGLDKLSTSRQMRFSLEIARALAGDLKIICIDRFESLGEDARKTFEAEAKADEFEYFIAQVTGGPLVVASNDAEPPSADTMRLAEKPGHGKVEYGKAGF